MVSAKSFRQLQTPDFYAGQFDAIERNVVLEPAWVRESIVVTATGTPTPQPQTSSAITVLGPLDLALRADLVGVLRLMPGAFVVQDGQRGAQASLFIRGGDSDDNKMLVDGVDAGDLGGDSISARFQPPQSRAPKCIADRIRTCTAPDAESGVVSLTTPHGTTSFPSLLFEGERATSPPRAKNCKLAGAHNKFDYLGAFSWLQTGNALPMDEYHVATAAANLGWQPNGSTQIRGTRPLWRGCNRRSQCLGLLSCRRQRYAERPGHLHQRVDR